MKKTEEDIKNQDKQIKNIYDQIKEKEKTEKNNKKNLTKDQLFKELSSVIQKYDGKIVTNVLTEMNSLKQQKNLPAIITNGFFYIYYKLENVRRGVNFRIKYQLYETTL